MTKEESFYVYNLKDLETSMDIWNHEMAQVAPWYAVKCNPDPMLVKQLAALGANFDCASPYEIDLVLNQGVSADRIIYANPCKRLCDITYAAEKGITLTTFDSVCELEKIKRAAPSMRVVLRMYANDPTAQCVLSNKFGAKEPQWEELVFTAMDLGLDLCGISFHVGSGASSPEAFACAIRDARRLQDLATSYGHKIDILDIGGGFSHNKIYMIAPAIRDAIAEHLPNIPQVIAEPGRFFAETCATLYTRVIGVRSPNAEEQHATITDGLYGSFNNLVYDHARVPHAQVHKLHSSNEHMTPIDTTLFGPTCDGFDTIVTTPMPKLSLGDFVYFRNMGAYTIAGACNFNGIQFMTPKCYYI